VSDRVSHTTDSAIGCARGRIGQQLKIAPSTFILYRALPRATPDHVVIYIAPSSPKMDKAGLPSAAVNWCSTLYPVPSGLIEKKDFVAPKSPPNNSPVGIE